HDVLVRLAQSARRQDAPPARVGEVEDHREPVRSGVDDAVRGPLETLSDGGGEVCGIRHGRHGTAGRVALPPTGSGVTTPGAYRTEPESSSSETLRTSSSTSGSWSHPATYRASRRRSASRSRSAAARPASVAVTVSP